MGSLPAARRWGRVLLLRSQDRPRCPANSCAAVMTGNAVLSLTKVCGCEKILEVLLYAALSLRKSGPVAQLGARFHGMEEVVGSIPTRSTKLFTILGRSGRGTCPRSAVGDLAPCAHGSVTLASRLISGAIQVTHPSRLRGEVCRKILVESSGNLFQSPVKIDIQRGNYRGNLLTLYRLRLGIEMRPDDFARLPVV